MRMWTTVTRVASALRSFSWSLSVGVSGPAASTTSGRDRTSDRFSGTARHQVAHAAAVRERLAGDTAVPVWLRSVLPLVALAQWGAVSAHLLVALVRRRLPRGRKLDTW